MICQVCQSTPAKPANVTPTTWAKRKFCSIECRTKAWTGKGHHHWNDELARHSTETHYCGCGCRTELSKYDSRGRLKQYVVGHQMTGKKRVFSEEWLAKIKEANKAKRRAGAEHWNWKGGITEPNHAIRTSTKYKEWRMACLRRDHFTCVNCGDKPRNVVVDHIKPFYLHPELRLEVTNGRTLCRPCDKELGFNYSKYLKQQKVA